MEVRGPVVLIAGSGRLPRLGARSLDQRRREHRILALKGFADRSTLARSSATVGILDLEGTLAILAAWRPSAVALVGGVERPSLPAMLAALAALRRGGLGDLLRRGDDGLLRGVVRLLEEHGHTVVGLQELAPDLLARPGVRGRRGPSPASARSVALGFDLLARLSPFDIGQAAVVSGSRVLAVEGPEGTDRMLGRVRPGWVDRVLLRRAPEGGVLVKAAKQGQDLRVDLPAIGPRTMARAARAGLDGVAYGAGATLVIDEEETIAAADRLGLFLVGIDPASRPGNPR